MERLIKILFVLAALYTVQSCSKDEVETNPFVFENTTVADFIKQAPDNNYYYYLSGTIGEIVNGENSHFMLSDKTGEVLVYGLWESIHGKRIRNMGDWKTGDQITIAALKGKFDEQPYAKEAYVVDSQETPMWLTPTNASITAEAGEIELRILTDAPVQLSTEAEWISIGEQKDNLVKLSVENNESVFSRFGYVEVASSDVTIRVKITQDGKTVAVKPISEAVTDDYVHVEGTVLALAADGYLLADQSGVIFVSIKKFNGIYVGATLSVTGSVKTGNYMTKLSPDITEAIQAEALSPGTPKELSGGDIDRLISETSAKDASLPASLKEEYVRIEGTVIFADGKTSLMADDKLIKVEPYKPGSDLDFEKLNGRTLKLDGYTIGLDNGILKVLLTAYEEVPIQNSIIVDGNYSDWADFEDLTEGKDLSLSHNLKPVVKLHSENGYVFGYIRVDKSEESTGYDQTLHNYPLKIAGRFYVWIDNDEITSDQGGGWLFNPKRYDHVIAYRITKTAGGYETWTSVAPRANEYYAECAIGDKHTDTEDANEVVGYMATTADGDILEGEFSFLAAKVGLYGKEKTTIGLEIGWDNGFNGCSSSLAMEGYEIELK